MTETPDGGPKAPPELPKALVDLVPPVVVGTVLWSVALGVTLLVRYAAGEDAGVWPATAIAGIGLGLLGLAIVGWQRRASRRGARGAQRGI
ncbi:MAG: DUF2530 domain-containing protein [Thermocrispum sp.]